MVMGKVVVGHCAVRDGSTLPPLCMMCLAVLYEREASGVFSGNLELDSGQVVASGVGFHVAEEF